MAIMIIPDKICSHCGGIKWHHFLKKSGFNKKTGERYIHPHYRCTVLLSEQAKQRYLDVMNNPQRLKVKQERNNKNQITYRQRHPEKVKEQRKEDYIKHKDNYRLLSRKSYRKLSEQLSDSYIKKSLSRVEVEGIAIKKSDISGQLIELQRKSIKLQRQLKLTNYGKNNQNN